MTKVERTVAMLRKFQFDILNFISKSYQSAENSWETYVEAGVGWGGGGAFEWVRFYATTEPSWFLQDPTIVCPVPLRMSPESPLLQSSDEDSPQTIGRQPGPKVRTLPYSTGGLVPVEFPCASYCNCCGIFFLL
jgi:hypothetical protein